MIDGARLAEVATVVPMLHAPAGKVTAAILGPAAGAWAAHLLRWRDVERLHLPSEIVIKDPRVTHEPPTPGSLHLLLLSPEQVPTPWVRLLHQDGVLQSMTLSQDRVAGLVKLQRALMGHHVPWREHLPQPVYGLLSRVGSSPPKATRRLPNSTQRLTERYLPSIYLFGRDELPLVFPAKEGMIPTTSL